MLSGIFIDRPRLAIVISIVITLAGLIALKALPVAQFPNIDGVVPLTHGGGCGMGHNEAVAPAVLMDLPLSRGYAVMSTTLRFVVSVRSSQSMPVSVSCVIVPGP